MTSKDGTGLTNCKLLQYNEESVLERPQTSLQEALQQVHADAITWVHIPKRMQPKLMNELAHLLSLPLTFPTRILATSQRTIMHSTPAAIYMQLQYAPYQKRKKSLKEEPLTMILCPHLVVTASKDSQIIQPVIERIHDVHSTTRHCGADYLSYRIVEEVMDTLVDWVDSVASRTAVVESQILGENETEDILEQVHRLRALSLHLRKWLGPLGEVLYRIERSDTRVMSDQSRPHWLVAQSHCRMLLDTLDTQRDILSGLMELHLSEASQNLNEVMKTLTIVATIFVPLTFIAGLYGMNFQHMPELHWRWGYPAALTSMLLVAGGMCVYFRKKRWI